jgi:tRNA-dihydrouridine synthase 4
MAAEGLLDNPALFAGHKKTPISCLKDWFEIENETSINHSLFQRHTYFMAYSLLNKSQRSELSKYTATQDIKDHLSTLLNF